MDEKGVGEARWDTRRYKIMARYQDNAPMEVDFAQGKYQANNLLRQYRLEYGTGWKLWKVEIEVEE